MRVNSPCSAGFAGSGQSPAAGLLGNGELNMRVNSPGSDDRGGAAGGGGGIGDAFGSDGSEDALNMRVNSPGPDTRDDDDFGGDAFGSSGSDAGAEGGALNMPVKVPGAADGAAA